MGIKFLQNKFLDVVIQDLLVLKLCGEEKDKK